MLLVLILVVLVVAQARLVALVARLVALAVVLDRFIAQARLLALAVLAYCGYIWVPSRQVCNIVQVEIVYLP